MAHLTPFLTLVLAGYAFFMVMLAAVSTWSNMAPAPKAAAKRTEDSAHGAMKLAA